MLPLVFLLVLLAAPAAARAELSVPAEVVPGEQVVVGTGGETGLEGGDVRLLPEVGGDAFGRAVVGRIGGGSLAFRMPATFDCVSGCSGTRRFFPGQRVSVSVCSVPATGGSGGVLTSSQFCVAGSTVVGGRARVLLRGRIEPRRAGRLVSARWAGWGGATARARGSLAGRRATAVASSIAECDGRLWYSEVVVRQDGRVVQALRDLAPC